MGEVPEVGQLLLWDGQLERSQRCGRGYSIISSHGTRMTSGSKMEEKMREGEHCRVHVVMWWSIWLFSP